MERQGNHSQENQSNIATAIEKLQASTDKLQSILTHPQAQADIQGKMAASAEQAMSRLQAKLMAMFSPFLQNSKIPASTNPYNAANKTIKEYLNKAQYAHR